MPSAFAMSRSVAALSIADSDTTKAKKRSFHGSFCDLLANLAEPGFEGCCLVGGLGIDDGGNLPQAR
jgi:hypothetical protein